MRIVCIALQVHRYATGTVNWQMTYILLDSQINRRHQLLQTIQMANKNALSFIYRKKSDTHYESA